jgi:hypothetical protein
MRALVWFRSDLRVLDNTALFHACKEAGAGVVAVFTICARQWAEQCYPPGHSALLCASSRHPGCVMAEARRRLKTEKVCGQICVVHPDSLSICVRRCTLVSLYVLCRAAMQATCGVLTDQRGLPAKSIPLASNADQHPSFIRNQHRQAPTPVVSAEPGRHSGRHSLLCSASGASVARVCGQCAAHV